MIAKKMVLRASLTTSFPSRQAAAMGTGLVDHAEALLEN